MDGNGRWATRQGLPRLEGHRRGYEVARNIVRAAAELGIQVLTLYTFSSENWRRPKQETDAIMHLIAEAARRELPDLQKNGVRLMLSGRIADLPPAVKESLAQDVQATKDNRRMVLNLAVNYGGRNEIIDAVRAIAAEVGAGRLRPEEIDETLFARFLYAPELPDPDLLIRTASELRVSNFLLWQIAYAEIWVTDVLWPDFTAETLAQAVADYGKRVRKFGAVVET